MKRKNLISGLVFLALLLLTIYVIFKDNSIFLVWEEVKKLQLGYLIGAILAALFFVSAEGAMIWYLLRALGAKEALPKCIGYSFIGFFFSGITPSASGGQPVQLYYMKKSGLRVADSTVVLMTVALIYKFVLCVLGVALPLLFWKLLYTHLGNYIYLYFFGLFLNILLVAVLLFVMISPRFFEKIVTVGEKILTKLHILKPAPERSAKIAAMADRYHQAVVFFLRHKKHIVLVTLFTFLQRCSLFFLTWLIYRGMGLTGESLLTIMILQASVYIAVDMLPLPGAQGITELMYSTVFSAVFPGMYLTASLCVTRGINFYFLLIVSGLATVFFHHQKSSGR